MAIARRAVPFAAVMVVISALIGFAPRLSLWAVH